MRFDEATAEQLLEALKNKGFHITKGLTDGEVGQIEKALGAKLPDDLALLFSKGVPMDEDGQFPDWHHDPEGVIEESRDFIKSRFSFDIENANYWHKVFGEKPASVEDAVKQALDVIDTWPPLIPLYSHRFLPSAPPEAGNPVISVWQPSDTVMYGENLVDYYNQEFDLHLPYDNQSNNVKSIPYWGDAFGLNS